MADYWPAANGLWSTLSNWLTATGQTAGVLPGVNDDVYADTRTIYIDINPNIRSIRTTARTGGTAGGGFVITTGTSLTGNLLAGTTVCLTFSAASPSIFTVTGNVSGGTGSGSYGINNTSSGTLNVIGNPVNGTFSSGSIAAGAWGIANTSSGIVFVRGFAAMNPTTSLAGPLLNNSTGSVYLFGNVSFNNDTSGVTGAIYNASTGYAYVSGNITATALTNSIGYGIVNAGAGRVDYIGTAQAGPAGSANRTSAILNNSTGTVNITGTVIGSSSNGGAGVSVSTGGTINILGTAQGGAGYHGAVIGSGVTATINITGSAIGGSGTNIFGALNNSNTGILNVYGSAIGGTGTGAHGVSNGGTGYVYVTKAVGNGFGLGSTTIPGIASGVSNTQNGKVYIEQAEFGNRGATPISGPVYILPSNRNTLTGYTTALGQTVTFYNSLSVSGLLPPASSVRLGTVYNVGNTTGTMAVPAPEQVEFGVAVDNTFGTAALTPQTIWNYSRLSATEVGSMGDRLRNAATTQSVGSQIASFNL